MSHSHQLRGHGKAMKLPLEVHEAVTLPLDFNTFDPDALIVGGGAIETGADFQGWFVDEIRAGMPPQREEQADIPIYIMPNGDTAGARGAAIEALSFARHSGLA